MNNIFFSFLWKKNQYEDQSTPPFELRRLWNTGALMGTLRIGEAEKEDDLDPLEGLRSHLFRAVEGW